MIKHNRPHAAWTMIALGERFDGESVYFGKCLGFNVTADDVEFYLELLPWTGLFYRRDILADKHAWRFTSARPAALQQLNDVLDAVTEVVLDLTGL